MRNGYAVRALEGDDVSLMHSMLRLFGEAFDDRAAYIENQPDDAYLRRLLSSDTFVAVVALRDGQLVGGLAGYVLPKFEQARSEFYIYDLAVDARHRRRGVATALITELQRILAGRGVHVVFVQADRDDEPAVSLYSKLGTREDVLHFDLAPTRPPR